MPDNVSGLPNRGKTYLSGSGRSLPSSYGQSAMLEGYTQEFKDVDSTSANPKTLRSNKMTTCMLVRNASGIALAAKRVVKWKSAKRNKQVQNDFPRSGKRLKLQIFQVRKRLGMSSQEMRLMHILRTC